MLFFYKTELVSSCVLEYKQPPLNAAHNDGTTLEVGVVGPGALEARAAAIRSNVKVSNLLHTVWILDV